MTKHPKKVDYGRLIDPDRATIAAVCKPFDTKKIQSDFAKTVNLFYIGGVNVCNYN